jgi:hypothetical protein
MEGYNLGERGECDGEGFFEYVVVGKVLGERCWLRTGTQVKCCAILRMCTRQRENSQSWGRWGQGVGKYQGLQQKGYGAKAGR